MTERRTSAQAAASKNGTAPPPQLLLGLHARLAHKQFPDRETLMVPEVSAVLGIDDKQTVSLINEGLLGAVEITGRGNKTSREHWRIPVECYDDYIRRRSNSREFTVWMQDILATMRPEQLQKLIAKATAELERRGS